MRDGTIGITQVSTGFSFQLPKLKPQSGNTLVEKEGIPHVNGMISMTLPSYSIKM